MILETAVFVVMLIATIAALGMLVAPHIAGPTLVFGTAFSFIAMVSGFRTAVEVSVIAVVILVVASLLDFYTSLKAEKA